MVHVVMFRDTAVFAAYRLYIVGTMYVHGTTITYLHIVLCQDFIGTSW